ncbi:COX5B-domain-containing protein [Cystobasidium minutum MCA 4210]|uniref:COX5B-domain-containing protein n=1 Tax=Cystobasidium minutum MCA 4210 TaxID=1397322 RepID=UPI0034CD72C2|eukprot:jgi/Rhomi1/156013/estExt_Genewise1.C_90259
MLAITAAARRIAAPSFTVKRAALIAAASRPISSSAIIKADHPSVPIIQGEGVPAGQVPTDEAQSTGLERMELLAKLRGEDPFHMAPLEVPYMGTPKNPVKVFSLDDNRIVGCTGFPVDSHDTLYAKVTREKGWRCPECGCAYALDFHGNPDAGHHH